jgi:hypothetical protein
MGGLRWLVVLLVVTNVAAVAALAWSQDWIPGFGPNRVAIEQQRRRELEGCLTDRRKLEGDRTTAERALAAEQAETSRLSKALKDAKADLEQARRHGERVTQIFTDLRHELFRKDAAPGSDLPAVAAWAAEAQRRTSKDLESTVQRLKATEGEKARVEDELDEERQTLAETAERLVLTRSEAKALGLQLQESKDREARAQASIQGLSASLETANERIREAGAQIRALDRQVKAIPRNTRLVMTNVGSALYLDWALVFYRTESGGIDVRSFYFADGVEGVNVATGQRFDFGDGFAVVFLALNPLNHAQRSANMTARSNGASGAFDFNPRLW